MTETIDSDQEPPSEDFLKRLDTDPVIALRIYATLRGRVRGLVINKFDQLGIPYSNEDVEDVVQRTFLVGLTKFAKGIKLDFSDPPDSLQSYFWRIGDLVSKEHRRGTKKSKRTQSLTEDESGQAQQLADPRENILEVLEDREEREIRMRCKLEAIKALSDSDRELVTYYTATESKSASAKKAEREALAETNDLVYGTLKVNISRIRKKIRSLDEKCLARKGLKPRTKKKIISLKL